MTDMLQGPASFAGGTPTLVGDGVRLREYQDDDVGLVRMAASDPYIPLVTTVPTNPGDRDVTAYIERQRGRARAGEGYQWVVEETSFQTPVGQIGVTWHDLGDASVGYWIASPFRRRGFAKAALRAVVSWAAASQLARLNLFVEPWNEDSWRVAEAVGFEREAVEPEAIRVGGEVHEGYIYALQLRISRQSTNA